MKILKNVSLLIAGGLVIFTTSYQSSNKTWARWIEEDRLATVAGEISKDIVRDGNQGSR